MKTRDAYFDNAKFLLIFFVVFGHLIQSYIYADKWAYALYTTIFTFHMPAFIVISGYFAKGFRKKGYIKKVTKKLILPYLIFQIIYSFYYAFIYEEGNVIFDPLLPHWSLWFLLSLFSWNLLLFLFARWRKGFSILLALALGILAGYFDDYSSFFSISRTFVFFPFFLFGFYIKKEHVDKLRNFRFRYISIFVLVGIFVTLYFAPNLDYKWLFGSKPYSALETRDLYAPVIRMGVYVLTFLATMSFLAAVPKQEYFFTNWGMYSLYIYLLHGFFVRYFRESELVEIFKGPGTIFILSLLSLLIIIIISSPVIRFFTQPLIELRASLIKTFLLKLKHNINNKNIPANMF